MPRHFKLDEIRAELSEPDRAELEALMRRPANTVDECITWLESRGCRISRGAVWKGRRNYLEALEQIREASEFGRAIRDNAEAGSDIAEGAAIQIVTAIQKQLIDLQAEGKVESGELAKLATALNASTGSRLDNVKLKQENLELKKQLAEVEKLAKAALAELENKVKAKTEISAADIADARKAIFNV